MIRIRMLTILKKLQTTITKENILIEIAYFDQLREALDLESSLEDFISPGSEWVEIGGQRKHVKSYLNDFLFSPERARSPVKTLSGGERNRLLLARLFAKPANVLVLDEPTNDLDVETLDLLQELLDDYDHKSLDSTGQTRDEFIYPEYEDYIDLIASMDSEFGSGVFARPKDDSFKSSINQIRQSFNGQELYPSLEEKAATLL